MVEPNDRGEPIPKSIRTAVFERDGHQCVVCGGHAHDCHHLIKRSQGGLHTKENLAAVCRRCHNILESNVLKLEGHPGPDGEMIFYTRGSRRGLFPRKHESRSV